METKAQKVLRIVAGVFFELWIVSSLLDIIFTFMNIFNDDFGLSFLFVTIRLVVAILLQIYTIRLLKNSPKSRKGLTIAMFVLMIFSGSSLMYAIYYYGLLSYLGLMIYEIMNKKSNRNLSLKQSIVATVLLIVLQLVGSCIFLNVPDWIYFLIVMVRECNTVDLWTISLLRPLMTFLASAVLGAYAIVRSVQTKKTTPVETVATAEATPVEAVAIEEVKAEGKATDAE